jgi:ubiquitin-protein ligase E3 A
MIMLEMMSLMMMQMTNLNQSIHFLCSDRSPIEGLSQLGFVISRNGNDDTRLPSAHTCFNHLLLPQYSSEDIMRDKLKYAIEHSEGFGLR